MSWKSALKKSSAPTVQFARPAFTPADIDWAHLVTVDLETYFDVDYTLRKLSTSEYVRDPRFKFQMVGIKIGRKPTKIYDGKKGVAALKAIDWKTHDLLCHNTAFDGFALSHYLGIKPRRYYDTLSMARGLHSNEIDGDLDSVAKFYGGAGKIDGFLEKTKGVRDWSPALFKEGSVYCAQDNDECFRIFTEMAPKLPADEIELIDLIIRMFCDPVLKVDIPRVEKEYARELERREKLLFGVADPVDYDVGGMRYDEAFFKKYVLKTGAERALEGLERSMQIVKRLIGNNEWLADQLRSMDIEPPRKLSPAWLKLPADQKAEQKDKQWAYAFAKDDLAFVNLPDDVDSWRGRLNPNKQKDVLAIAAKRYRLECLVNARLAVKSTGNITRAERFLEAGKDGMPLPVGYAYSRAHTHRLGGNNKMNMQNLARGGELRMSILAPPGHHICVADSGQIEARVNGWLWGQDDLLQAFVAADQNPTGPDAYTDFAEQIYYRPITKSDKTERFVGKVCIAENELVLTQRGLVPIQLISTEDWLWDGVEWVQHDGLIDQGIQHVITYDGLTATPDHEVFTEDGRIVPLGQAASEMARLQRTGIEGQGIRFSDDHVVADSPRKRLSVRIGQMRPDWYYEADVSQQLEVGQDDFLSQERQTPNSECSSPWPAIRRDRGPMQQPEKQTVGELWRSGNQVFVQDPDGVHHLGVKAPSSFELQGRGDRPSEQRRALPTRESAFSVSDTKLPQQTVLGVCSNDTRPSSYSGVEKPVLSYRDLSTGAARDDCRTDYEECERRSSSQTQELALNRRATRVYDIANAGPRRRFTVSGTLVLNCVLGLGYQMGAPKLQITLAKGALGGPPVFFDLQTCHRIVNTYRMKNYKIRDGWSLCTRIIEDMAAGRTGSHKCLVWEKDTLWLPNGMSLKYPGLKLERNEETGWDEWSYQVKDYRAKIYGGLLCENIVQALARIIVMSQMLVINRKYRAVMTTHDEVAALAKIREADKCTAFMIKTMRTPLKWCADLPLNAEGGHDVNYSK